VILYGISTCDTCKKALKALQAAGREVSFRDVRAQPLRADEIAAIVVQFGSRAVNMRSTTYRGFGDVLRASEPEAQIAAQPAVMQRPVIRDGDRWYLGWDSATRDRLAGPG